MVAGVVQFSLREAGEKGVVPVRVKQVGLLVKFNIAARDTGISKLRWTVCLARCGQPLSTRVTGAPTLPWPRALMNGGDIWPAFLCIVTGMVWYCIGF